MAFTFSIQCNIKRNSSQTMLPKFGGSWKIAKIRHNAKQALILFLFCLKFVDTVVWKNKMFDELNLTTVHIVIKKNLLNNEIINC